MRASYPGEMLPSQMSPCARVKHAEIPLTDLGTDQSDVCVLAIPALDRRIVIGRIVLGCHETFNAAGTNEQQTLTETNGSAGETFKLAFNGSEKTGPLAYDISAADLQTALQALSTINGANCSVAGNAGGPYTVTFIGTLAAADQPLLVVSDCTPDLTMTPAESVKGKTAAANSAVVKVGTRKTSTQDVDAIAIIDIAPAMAVGTAVVAEADDMESTLKTSKSEWPNFPVIQPDYAVEVNLYKNLVAGNAGKLKGFIEWWYADDVNPA